MGYNLGDVKPHVQAAADLIGPKFSIRNIGGYRSRGSVPGSDHPKGLALDVMTGSKAIGDQVAAFAINNAKALGIKYVIWWRRIWLPGQGWKNYSGPSAHTDHVHLSFTEKPGTGKLADSVGAGVGAVVDALTPDSMVGAIRGVRDQLATIGTAATSVGKVAEAITRAFLPSNILRGAAGLAGTLFVLIGVWFLSREVRNS